MQIHDANLKHNGNWSYRNSTSEIILHHAEASHASVEDINQWHLERGWGQSVSLTSLCRSSLSLP